MAVFLSSITITHDGIVDGITLSAIALADLPSQAVSTLLGHGDSGAGTPQVITLGAGLAMTGTTLSATGSVTAANDSQTVDLTLAATILTAAVRHQMSIVEDASGLKLDGDSASPGTWRFYGTEGTGTRGYHTFDEPAQDAVGSILTDTDTIDLTYNDGTPSITAAARLQMSITSDASGIKLSGDSASPGNWYFYGTQAGGTKGYQALNGAPGVVKAWVKFDGGANVLGSLNVANVTDQTLGVFRITWTSGPGSANYAVVVTGDSADHRVITYNSAYVEINGVGASDVVSLIAIW